jgi:hypothetical protein
VKLTTKLQSRAPPTNRIRMLNGIHKKRPYPDPLFLGLVFTKSEYQER